MFCGPRVKIPSETDRQTDLEHSVSLDQFIFKFAYPFNSAKQVGIHRAHERNGACATAYVCANTRV